MTVAPIAARAVATRAAASSAAKQGGGKVIEGKVVTQGARRPAQRATSGGRSQRVNDAATGAGVGKLLDGGAFGRGAKALSDTVAPPSQARKLLVAEFTLCLVVLAFSPLTDKHKAERPGAFMKRASATMGVFFVLGLVATAGRGASRAAAGFGGLVTLVLLISQRSIFTVLTAKLGSGVGEDDPDQEGSLESAGKQAADTLGNIVDEVTDDDQRVPDAGVRPPPVPLFPINGIR